MVAGATRRFCGGKVSAPDWRRQGQEGYLLGKELQFLPYAPYRPGWEHDHCEFCGRKIGLTSDALHEGYCTLDLYHWICAPCFSDFSAEFGWSVRKTLGRI